MAITSRDVYEWLTRRFHNYQVEPNPVYGTYGLVWFLRGDAGDFAVKTLAPERLQEEASKFDADYLRREFRIWLALPSTSNVLPALGFDIANLLSEEGEPRLNLPVMRMPRRLGSLQDWVESRTYSYEDRLVALAQAFNGLLSLYEHGIQGHGDLKPSNILYDDLRSFALERDGSWPSRRCPWRIQVADLGWADAWVDLGFTNKAQRQYLAPERLDKTVVPGLSDVFSMGIIASEVLQGRHPSPNLPKALGSEGKWRRWVESGERDLSDISSPRLEKLILQCLQPNPSDRPTPSHCLTELCKELEDNCGYSIDALLDIWRRPGEQFGQIALDEHAAWAASESTKLDERQALKSREHLEGQLEKLNVRDLESCERWVALARGLVNLLRSGSGSDDALTKVREQARVILENILGRMAPDDLNNSLRRRDHSALVRPFERFSEVVTAAAQLAGVDPRDRSGLDSVLGNYALAALAFGAASEARWSDSSVAEQETHLADAIRLSPNEGVPYYFRARWAHDRALIRRVISGENFSEVDRQLWLGDIEVALACDPSWQEAIELLETIRSDK